MSTEQQQSVATGQLRLEDIEEHLSHYDMPAEDFAARCHHDPNVVLAVTFDMVRPILTAVVATPLIPTAVRACLQRYIDVNDQVTPAFKAGKDLAIGPIAPAKQ